MADKIVSLEFNVKTASAVTEINKVTKATEGATTATNNFENQLEDIKKATDGGGFKDLSRAIKQYQDIALQAGETSPIGRQALAEAGELKDRLGDLKDAIRTTGQDGLGLQASLQLGGGIVAGFGAVQGVMALVGSESEDLQKTLVKLQAVQATLASIEEIRAVLQKESAFMITATTVAEKARAAATAVSTYVTNASSLALKGFKAALVATGIGAFIVVLGSVIAYWDELTQAIGLSTKSTADYTAALDKLAAKEQRRLNNKIELQKNELKLAELKGESDKQLFEREKKINDLELAARERQRETDQKLIESFQKRRKAGENFSDDEKQRFDELKENEKNYYSDIRKIEFDARIIKETFYQNEKKKAEEREKAAEDKRKADLKKAADDRRALEKELAAELQADKDKLAEDEKLAAQKKFSDDQQLMLARTELFAADLAGEKASADSKKAYDQEVFDTKVRLAMQGFDLINQLAALSGDKSKANAERAFKINKAYQLAVAINDGYKAVLSTYAETKGGPVLKGIAAALAGGFAAVQISKIAQSKFDSSKFDNTKAPGGEIPLTSAAPTQTQAPQTPGRVSNLTGSQTTTVKAIVVESDITTTQKRINSIQELAKI